jgi:hypothetical protein
MPDSLCSSMGSALRSAAILRTKVT